MIDFANPRTVDDERTTRMFQEPVTGFDSYLAHNSNSTSRKDFTRRFRRLEKV